MTYTEPDAIAAIARAIQTEQNYVFAAGLAGAFLRGAGRRKAVNQLAEHRARLQAKLCGELLARLYHEQSPSRSETEMTRQRAQEAHCW